MRGCRTGLTSEETLSLGQVRSSLRPIPKAGNILINKMFGVNWSEITLNDQCI